jgi:hypothetical protein
MHFGWLCLVVLLIVVDRAERHPRLLWLLPPLFCLWINLHGSWLLGFVVLGVLSVDAVTSAWRGRALATSSVVGGTHLLAVMAASAAALFVNPYGWRLVWYPFDLLFRQQANTSTVFEWQSVDFHSGYGKLAMIMVLGVLAVAVFTRESWRVRDLLLLAFALWASLTHARFLILAAILLPPIIAPRLSFLRTRDRERDIPGLNLALIAILLLAMIRTVPSGKTLQARIDHDFPRSALAFMQDHGINGRMFHLYDFGGFIEWNAPSQRTFADGRTDIFVYNGVFADYLKIVALDSTLELLARHDIRYVLYPPHSALTYLLDRTPGWRMLYGDDTARLYEHVGSTAPNGSS